MMQDDARKTLCFTKHRQIPDSIAARDTSARDTPPPGSKQDTASHTASISAVTPVAPAVLRRVRVVVIAAALPAGRHCRLVDSMRRALHAQFRALRSRASAREVTIAFFDLLQSPSGNQLRGAFKLSPLTSLAYTRPHALHSVRGPGSKLNQQEWWSRSQENTPIGPLRHSGVEVALQPRHVWPSTAG